jgi:hypothetical protein
MATELSEPINLTDKKSLKIAVQNEVVFIAIEKLVSLIHFLGKRINNEEV